MKKQLLALAVAGAIAAPAMAQNVSIYGTIGTAWVNSDSSTVSSDTTDGDQLSSSVFGFKGGEDLGGGLKAFWALESAIKAGNGQQKVAGTFDEKSLVGFEGSFGTIGFGLQGTVYDSHKSFGNMGANLFSATDGELDDLTGPVAETLRYDSPKFGGLSFSLSTTNTTGGTQDINSYAVSYVAGAFAITVSGAEGNDDESEATVNLGYTGFPGLKLHAQFQTGEESGKTGQSNWKLGADYAVTGKLNLLASIQSYQDDRETANEDAMGLMAVYNLSKRTAAFAGYNVRDIAGADTKVTTIGVQHKF